MEKIIPNGTEVLIFKYIRGWGINQINQDHFIKGVILSSKESDDLSLHGSPYQVQIYEVLGEDGQKYCGSYELRFVGNSFFRTVDDHIQFIRRRIEENNEEINKLRKSNDMYLKTITDLSGIDEEYIDKFYDPEFSSYDFMCLFVALKASQKNYSFSRDNLIRFISFCKKNGLFNRLLRDIHIKNNGIFDFSDDLTEVIQKLKLGRILYTNSPETDSTIMIFDDTPMAELIKTRINYFDEMVDFLGKYEEYEFKMISQGYQCFCNQESKDIDNGCATLRKIRK